MTKRKPKPKPFLFGKPKLMTKERSHLMALAGSQSHADKRVPPLPDPFEQALALQQERLKRG